MKQFTKGLASLYDVSPIDIPEGFYVYALNGMYSEKKGTVTNEPGFTERITFPGKINGIIETPRYPVVMVKNATTGISSIGFANLDTNTFDVIISDTTLGFALPFDLEKPITGEAEFNYKNELCIAFTNGNAFPMFLNCDKPDVTTLTDLNLFPIFKSGVVDATLIEGGSLEAAAYYAAIKLGKEDGTNTGYFQISDVMIVAGAATDILDKAIQVTLTGLDISYDNVTVCIIRKKGGILTCNEMAPVQIPQSGNTNVVYSGEQITTAITLEEVLVPRKVYKRVQDMGQLNGALYLLGVDDEEELFMQKYANLVKVEVTSKLIDVNSPDPKHTSGKERGLGHSEVYALYIAYERTSGGYTQAYHLPGRRPSNTDSQIITLPNGSTGPRYQVEDRIENVDTGARTCSTGVWVNMDELYPDNEHFDSSAIGGVNLRNQPVAHHRMPSIKWCKEYFYSADIKYGQNMLDMLGIKISNIVIPQEYKDKLTGKYQLFFAKKTVNNMTVLGQSLLLYGAKNFRNGYVSTGGNFYSEYALRNGNAGRLNITPEVVRFHAFDMLVNKPQTSPDYLQTELKLGITNIASTPGIYFEDQTRTGDPKNESIIGYKLDYTKDGNIPTHQRNYIKVKDRLYLPNNLVLDRYENTYLEAAVVMKAEGSLLVTATEGQNVQVHNNGTGRQFAVRKEDTFLTSAMVLRRNCYAPFTSQPLVRMGIGTGVTTFYGGDTFISDYTFHTNGWFSPRDDFNSGTGQRNKQGTRTIRRFVCETAANLYARYEDLSNKYSHYYPKRAIKDQDPDNYILFFDADQDPNQFAYHKDSNSLNDLLSVKIWSPTDRTESEHPFRIHRNGKMDRQSKKRSWRTSLPLDYYELQKNMGKPVKVYGMQDRLLIHHENALFVTQDKTKLESDVLSITLGSGDIFQFEPQATASAKLGTAGTQHKLACVQTPYGYMFVDSKSGDVFLTNVGSAPENLNSLFNRFFQKFLRIKETNVFTGNGYTIGYDHENGRFLLTAKSIRLKNGLSQEISFKLYEDTQAFLQSLAVNDIIYKDGKYLKFLGIYNGTQPYDCPALPEPVCSNQVLNAGVADINSEVTFSSSSYNATEFFITSGNSDALFSLSQIGTTLKLKFTRRPTVDGPRVLTLKAQNGVNYCNFTVTVNFTAVDVVGGNGFSTSIAETATPGTVVGTVTVNNTASVFTITSPETHPFTVVQTSATEAEVRVASALDYETDPAWEVTVEATTGYGNISLPVYVAVTNVNEAPNVTSRTLEIFDTTPVDSVITTVVINDDTTQSNELVRQVIEESSPGKLVLNADNEVILTEAAVIGESYTMTIRIFDNEGLFSDLVIAVTVVMDPANIKFRPSGHTCATVCPSGFIPTPDDSQCYRTLNTTSVPPSSPGSAGLAVRRTDPAYNNDGMRVYKVGEFNSNGTALNGAASYTLVDSLARPFWRNNNTTNGRLNGCGVWRKNACLDPTFLDTAWEYIGFSRTFNLSVAKTVYIGMAADNLCKVKINGATFIQQVGDDTSPDSGPATGINFNYWHIYPVALSAGTHIIELLALNQGSQAIMGLEIYDNSEAQILAANSEGELTFLFSTKDMNCQPFNNGTTAGYSCADPTYSLNTAEAPPICTKVEYTPKVPGGDGATITNVQVIDDRTETVLATYPNDGTTRYYQSIPIPIYPLISGSSLCGGATVLYHSALQQSTLRKNNCTEGLGSLVTYNVQDGKYFSIVSQAAANALATADLAANAQTYANTKGTCQ